jgi:Fe-S cluster biogenesis protein NfuA
MAQDNELKAKVQKAFSDIRPVLQADGGDVELVDVKDGVVKVRLVGACMGCPMASMTLTHGIEKRLKQQVPEIKKVESV